MQLQLDIYGELMDAVYLYDKYGAPISHDLWQDLLRLVDWVTPQLAASPTRASGRCAAGAGSSSTRASCAGWRSTAPSVSPRKRSFPAPDGAWHDVRDEIYDDIFTRFWNADRKTFVQHAATRPRSTPRAC